MKFWAASLFLERGRCDEHWLLGEVHVAMARQQSELCECRGRKKGRQDILRILMYIRGHWIKFTHCVLRTASVLQMKNYS